MPIVSPSDADTMAALEFRHEIGRYLASRIAFAAAPRLWSARLAPLHPVRLPRPHVDREGWSTLAVRLAGICGSDISMMTGKDSLYLEPEATYPFIPGHEIVGESNGRRVAVSPVLGCRARGLEPCRPCAERWDGFCERRGGAWPSRGLAIGFNRDTGGGWAEACLVHASQLWPLPDSIGDRDALLLDPAAAALAALLRTNEPAAERTVVLGGGTIGLLVAHLHRSLGLSGDCELLVRYEHQRAFAERLGIRATTVRGNESFRAWGADRGIAMQRVQAYGYVHRGVFDRVIDAAGSSESFAWASAAVRPRGRIVLLTSPASLRAFDPTPLWYREVTIRGIYQYGPVRWEGRDVHPYDVLLPRLANGSLRFADYMTHEFPLDRYADAFHASVHRGESGAVKVAFRPGSAS